MSFRGFCEENGYEIKTTFWEDFSIADVFGLLAIEDTYNRAFEEWKENCVFLTELVLVLNHKIWQHHQSHEAIARLYDKLWRQAYEYGCNNLKDEELDYFYKTLD